MDKKLIFTSKGFQFKDPFIVKAIIPNFNRGLSTCK